MVLYLEKTMLMIEALLLKLFLMQEDRKQLIQAWDTLRSGGVIQVNNI